MKPEAEIVSYIKYEGVQFIQLLLRNGYKGSFKGGGTEGCVCHFTIKPW